MQWENLKKVLDDYGKDLKEAYQTQLKQTGKGNGDLARNIVVLIKYGDDIYKCELQLEEYWKYVEYDTKPHFPPPDALLRWIERKRIIPREVNGITPSNDQLAYLIGRKISREGTKGGHQLETATNQTQEKYNELFAEAIAKDIEIELNTFKWKS